MRQHLFVGQQVRKLDPRTFPSLALCLSSSIGFLWTVPSVAQNELCCDTACVSLKDVQPRASQVQLQVKAGQVAHTTQVSPGRVVSSEPKSAAHVVVNQPRLATKATFKEPPWTLWSRWAPTQEPGSTQEEREGHRPENHIF